jgi:hypothetical protein
VITLIALPLILGGLYFIFFKESPAAQYLRASCEAIKSSPISKGIESNEKLLKVLNFNLNLAKKADEKVTFDLSQYVDELQKYVKEQKENDEAIRRMFQLDLALGILGDKNSGEIVDDALDRLKEKSDSSQKELTQKMVGIKNTYIKACSGWIDVK